MGQQQDSLAVDQLTSIFSPVLVDETARTGVACVLRLMEGLDTSGISASLPADMPWAVSADLPVDSSELTSNILDHAPHVITFITPCPANALTCSTKKDSFKVLNETMDDLDETLLLR